MSKLKKDPLLPTLIIHDVSIPAARQQCLLKATNEARNAGNKSQTLSASDALLCSEETAVEEAKKRCFPYTHSPTEKQYLGQLILTFGKYNGKTFKWMVENDVGYLKYLLDKHVKESKNPDRKAEINEGWLKDYLLQYVGYFSPVSTHLEMNVDQCIYGQGQFKSFTFKEMYQWYRAHKDVTANPQIGTAEDRAKARDAYTSTIHWLTKDEGCIASKALKRYRQYILEKEKADTSTTPLLPQVQAQPQPDSAPGKPATSSVLQQQCTASASTEHDSLWEDDSCLLEVTDSFLSKGLTLPPPSKPSTSSRKAAAPVAAPVAATKVQTSKESQSSSSPQVTEGWQKAWETGLPKEDIHWLRSSTERGLFKEVEHYKQRTTGAVCARRVLKDDRMWFYPPERPGLVSCGPPHVHAFFRSRLFFWRPVGVWGYSFRCPRKICPAKDNAKAYLYRCGYSSTVRYICDISEWYCMLTEMLACSACTKASKLSSDLSIGRFTAWDWNIISQLTPAHQAIFPAVLTPKRGVDKKVVHLLRDRSCGNTMTKTWRQIQEKHCEEYLNRKDLYTTLLETLTAKGGIVGMLGHKFQPPPPRRELPSARLMRKAFLIAEAENIEDYRAQIQSTFGTVLKFDSTKKICKKLAGSGQGTAEWCTNVSNEHGQILNSVLTCEESVEMLQPMANGLIHRYSNAKEEPPKLMYVDCGCCRTKGQTAHEKLFGKWVEAGMTIRLDIFHWIHRFDAAVRTDHHVKYPLFKSALSAAVFAYNKDDMTLLAQALRQGHGTKMADLSDVQVIQYYASRDDVKHFMRRITVGATETFTRVQNAINILKGPAGLDDEGVHLFKSDAAIDEVWAGQQKHLECMQDPPDFNMYVTLKTVKKNGVSLAFYKTVRGSNSLEGFHSFLPSMIPGPRCAAVPFQVYLLSGIARWNSDRESASVKGQQGRKYRVYSSPLISRLNDRCQKLFGETEEVNYRPPVPVSTEMLGLEFLFSQSDDDYNKDDLYQTTLETLQSKDDVEGDDEVVQTLGESEEEEEEDDEVIEEDDGYTSERESTPLSNLQVTNAAVTSERDPCEEDVCGPCHLPGYQHVENLCNVLVNLASKDHRLTITAAERQKVTAAWNKLDIHDRNIKQFDSLYTSRWGYTCFGRTNGDPDTASITQKLKFGKRRAPAQLVNPRKNRVVFCLLKLLWLHPMCRAQASSPQKHLITNMYQRLQQRVTVDDPQLSKLGIPLVKINAKSVADFIRRQEALTRTNVTDQGLAIIRRTQSVSGTNMPPALDLPDVRPTTSRPQMVYSAVPNMAGTRSLKVRRDHFASATVTSADTTGPVSSTLPSAGPSTAGPSTAGTSTAGTSTAGTSTAGTSTAGTSTAGPSTAGTSTAGTSTAAGPSTAGPSLAAGPSTAGTSTRPTQLSGQPMISTAAETSHTIARSTAYKRRREDKDPAGGKKPFLRYVCKLCGQTTQGHRKYKKKSYCEKTSMSSSAGLTDQVYANFEEFKKAVDDLSSTIV